MFAARASGLVKLLGLCLTAGVLLAAMVFPFVGGLGLASNRAADTERLLAECRIKLPNFMVPHRVEWRDAIPRNPNGKYDRPKLAAELGDLFDEDP